MEEFRFIELNDEIRTELYTTADKYEKYVKHIIKTDQELHDRYKHISDRIKNWQLDDIYEYKIHDLYDHRIYIHPNENSHNEDSYELNIITRHFINVVEKIKQRANGHPLQQILENFSLDNDNIQLFLTKYDFINVGSLLSFGRAIKIIVQSVDLYSQYRTTDLEREILAESEQYIENDITHYLKDAIDWVLEHISRHWHYIARHDLFMSKLSHINNQINNDLIRMIPMADLAYEIHSRDVPDPDKKLTLTLDPVQLTFKNGPLNHKFSLVKDLKGFVGYDRSSQSYILAFRGTNVKSLYNILTDIQQILFGADITYLMSIGILSALVKQKQGANINVVGHSLGGGLAQYATIAVGGNNLKCYCYNSAGLSHKSVKQLKNRCNTLPFIQHLYVPYDVVFLVGAQYGEVSVLNTRINPISAHLLGTIRKKTEVDDIYWMW